MRYSRLEYGKGIFQLPYTVAHLCNFGVQLLSIGQDEPGPPGFSKVFKALKLKAYRVPWPVIRLPLGQMAEHPLRLQLLRV